MGTDDGFSYGTPGNCRECIGENNLTKFCRNLSQPLYWPMDNVDTKLSKPNIILLCIFVERVPLHHRYYMLPVMSKS